VVKFLLTGTFLGVAGVMLAYWGNPPNSGICVSCFMENIVGSMGFHHNTRMQYIRPEIIGFVLGSFLASLRSGEFRVVGGSSPLLRFFIGAFLIVGCAVFMGCPIKMVLRLGAGDLTALAGLAGLVGGVYVGLKFLEGGFRLGPERVLPQANGLLMPGFMLLLLVLLLWRPSFLPLSQKGAGALHAPVALSLGASLLIGALAQRSGFCITGGIARVFLWGPRELRGCPRSTGLLVALGAFFGFALFSSILTGQFMLGWHGQPSSNEDYFWNFAGLFMVGFGSVLIKGCPFRQLIKAGQGDCDAGFSVLGMMAGAAMVQNWHLGGTAAGTPPGGQMAVLLGICGLLLVGILYRERGYGMAPEYQSSLD